MKKSTLLLAISFLLLTSCSTDNVSKQNEKILTGSAVNSEDTATDTTETGSIIVDTGSSDNPADSTPPEATGVFVN